MRNQATYYIIGLSKTLVLFLMRCKSLTEFIVISDLHNNSMGGVMWLKAGLEWVYENREGGMYIINIDKSLRCCPA